MEANKYTTKKNLSGWTLEHEAELIDLVGLGFSFSQSAVAINEKFDTHYTRNAAVGKAHRIKLVAIEKPKLPPAPRKPQPYKPRPKKPRSFIPIETVRMQCAEIVPGNVSLIDCDDDGCRWAVNEISPFLFCNHSQLEGSSYCWAHTALSLRGNGS